MKIADICLANYTVFEDVALSFAPGINIIIGKNGTGKTHLMKLLYSAGMCANGRITFANKLVRTMMPLDLQISRLVSRHRGNQSANIRITSESEDDSSKAQLKMSFHKKTKKWDAEVSGIEKWEKMFASDSIVFIPAKEVLSNNYNLFAAVERGNVRFDDTYLDIINAAKVDISVGRDAKEKSKMLKDIEKMLGGKVVYDANKDTFFLKVVSSKQEFSLVSEGIRKLALLWTLVKNGALDKNSVLFWDEPEANINPSSIPIVTNLLLALQRNGVQIFISTHDYFLSKYLEVNRKDGDSLKYHSLYYDNDILNCESSEQFTLLNHNAIMDAFVSLYRDEVGAAFDE